VYATWTNPTTDAATKSSCGTGTTNFGKSITGLTEGTLYYVRAYAINAMGTAYGAENTFTTTAVTVPAVGGVTVSNVGVSTATVSSTVISNGNDNLTDAGFCWSVNPLPSIYDSKISCGTTNTALSANLTGLNTATTYYVRAYATNSKGTAYSSDATFTTEDPENMRYYVSITGNDNNNGRSWAAAKKTIGAAMTLATNGYQIWVDDGTYQENVTLKDGVNLYGGFSGSETGITQRTSKTTLLRTIFSQVADFNTATTVDGFISSLATAQINIRSNGIVNNCEINGNTAATSLYIYEGGLVDNSVVTNSKGITNYGISNHSTYTSNTSYFYNYGTVENCTINPTSGSYLILNSNSRLINTSVTQTSYIYALYVSGTNVRIEGCKILSSYTSSTGASGIYISGTVDVVNCTVKGYYCGINAYSGTVNIANCIVIPGGYSSATSIYNGANAYITNTISNGNFSSIGQGNIQISAESDYKLNADWSLKSDSPAVNAGSNSFVTTSKDINGNTRVQGGRVDIGAVESGY
jgi:hypothetical protein